MTPPSGTSNTVTVQENGTYTLGAGDFGFSDAGGGTLSAVEITTLPGAGTLSDNGVAIGAGYVVSAADINGGKLVFTPTSGTAGNGYASFSFQVEDSNGGVDPSPKTMTFNVAPLPPAGSNNTVTIQENGSHTFSAGDFGFSDVNGTTLASIEITSLPGAGTLTDGGVAVAAGSLISITDIDAGKLVYTPAAGNSGNNYAGFSFQVQDSAGAVSAKSNAITFNVTALPPAGTNTSVTAQENGSYTFSAANFGFMDVNGTTLSAVEITTLPSAGSLTCNGVAVTAGMFVSAADINAGKLVYTPDANASGSNYTSFTFQVRDSNGNLDPHAKTIAVNVNPGPAGSTGSTSAGGTGGATGSIGSGGAPGSSGAGDGSATHSVGTGGTTTAGSSSNHGATSASNTGTPGSANIDSVAVNVAPGSSNASATNPGGDTIGAGQSGATSSASSPDAGDTSKTDASGTQSTQPDTSGGPGKPSTIVGSHVPSSPDYAEGPDSATPSYDAVYFIAQQQDAGIVGNALFPDNWNLNPANKLQGSLASLSYAKYGPHHRAAASSADHEAGSGGDTRIVMEEQKRHAAELRAEAIEVAGAISSLGLIWVAGREAALAASFLAAVPAWQRIDPLPLFEKDEENAVEEEDNLDIADHLFSNINASSQKNS